MAKSLLLLSQTQAKSAISLKKILKLQPKETNILSSESGRTQDDSTGSTSGDKLLKIVSQPVLSQKDRLRATLRGALNNHNHTEADISESTFLGRAISPTIPSSNITHQETEKHTTDHAFHSNPAKNGHGFGNGRIHIFSKEWEEAIFYEKFNDFCGRKFYGCSIRILHVK
jgi:hypothetical protein